METYQNEDQVECPAPTPSLRYEVTNDGTKNRAEKRSSSEESRCSSTFFLGQEISDGAATASHERRSTSTTEESKNEEHGRICATRAADGASYVEPSAGTIDGHTSHNL
jgi:hypothetical protein